MNRLDSEYSRVYPKTLYVQCSNIVKCPKCLVRLRLQVGTNSVFKYPNCNTVIELIDS